MLGFVTCAGGAHVRSSTTTTRNVSQQIDTEERSTVSFHLHLKVKDSPVALLLGRTGREEGLEHTRGNGAPRKQIGMGSIKEVEANTGIAVMDAQGEAPLGGQQVCLA